MLLGRLPHRGQTPPLWYLYLGSHSIWTNNSLFTFRLSKISKKIFSNFQKKNYTIRDTILKISNQNQNGKTKAIFSHIDMGAKLSEGIFNTRFDRWLHRCSHCSSTGKISFLGWVFSRVIPISVFWGLNFEIIGPLSNILLTQTKTRSLTNTNSEIY